MSNHRLSSSQTEPESRDPIVLAVDTSAPYSSYALAQGDQILATISSRAFVPHSRTFFANLRTLLNLANLEIGRVDLFAAATGPGSFTGLRVGLAAVKGLAGSLGKPSIGVNSIDLQALSISVSGLVMVLIDAGREEVYCGLRRIDAAGKIETVGLDGVGPVSVQLGQIENYPKSVMIVGSGAIKYQKEIEAFGLTLGVPIKKNRLVDPDTWATLGWQLIGQTEMTTAAALARNAAGMLACGAGAGIHAYYVRPSDAEIKR